MSGGGGWRSERGNCGFHLGNKFFRRPSQCWCLGLRGHHCLEAASGGGGLALGAAKGDSASGPQQLPTTRCGRPECPVPPLHEELPVGREGASSVCALEVAVRGGGAAPLGHCDVALTNSSPGPELFFKGHSSLLGPSLRPFLPCNLTGSFL